MSATYGAIYVRNKGAQADKRPLVGDEWVAYEVASDLLPGSDGELMSKVLSEKYGEAIYVFDDEGNDQLYYEHCKGGAVLRRLTYSFNGSESTWEVVEGTPEPWESELFSEAQLKWALDVMDESEHDHIRELFESRTLELGFMQPRAATGIWMERHFQITRPPLKRR